MYIRTVLFNKEILVLRLALDENGEPIVKNIQNITELSREEQDELIGLPEGVTHREFTITAFE